MPTRPVSRVLSLTSRVRRAPPPPPHRREAQRLRREAGPPHLAGDLLTGAPVEKFEAVVQGGLAVRGLDGGGISGVDEGERPVRAAVPDRLRDRVEQTCERGQAALGLVQRVAQLDQLAALLGGLAQAQQRPAAHRLPLRLDEAPGEAAQVRPEAGAALAQCGDRRLEELCVLGREPRAEGQQMPGAALAPARILAPQILAKVLGEPRVADNARLAASGPGDEHLALGMQQHLRPVMRTAELGELVLIDALLAGPADAFAQVDERQDGREQDQAEDDGEAGNVVRLHRSQHRLRFDGRSALGECGHRRRDDEDADARQNARRPFQTHVPPPQPTLPGAPRGLRPRPGKFPESAGHMPAVASGSPTRGHLLPKIRATVTRGRFRLEAPLWLRTGPPCIPATHSTQKPHHRNGPLTKSHG